MALTSRLGRGHGATVEGGTVPGHGPHLVAAPDGDGGEGLVGAHMQPGGALQAGRRDTQGGRAPPLSPTRVPGAGGSSRQPHPQLQLPAGLGDRSGHER